MAPEFDQLSRSQMSKCVIGHALNAITWEPNGLEWPNLLYICVLGMSWISSKIGENYRCFMVSEVNVFYFSHVDCNNLRKN